MDSKFDSKNNLNNMDKNINNQNSITDEDKNNNDNKNDNDNEKEKEKDVKKISTSFLIKLQSPFLNFEQGNENSLASFPLPPLQAQKSCLCFVSSKEQLLMALEKEASIIVAHNKINVKEVLGLSDFSLKKNLSLFSTPSIAAAMALILPFFDTKRKRFSEGIHPQSFIHPTAQIGKEVSVGPFAVVGENVFIGDNCLIGSNVVIEVNARVESNSIIHPHVFVGAGCEIGAFCEVHPHTSLGADGYGYVTDEQGLHHKIPQLGKVVLEDHVEIGANCAIDRATLTETRICQGTKIDNLVHIAHNCLIGKNGLLTAGLMMAGSTSIGDNFKTGGHVSVADHLKITNNVTIGGASVVTKNISQEGMYAGYPLESFREALKNIANISNLTEMRRDLFEIKKKLDL